MESSESLKLKIAIMEQELKLMKMRLEYNLLVEQKSSITLDSQSPNEQAGILPKNTIVSSSTQQKDKTIPSTNPGKQIVSSPEQTATGKDKSNPLTAEALPKSLNQTQSSRLISETVNLRPNQGLKIERIHDDEFQTPKPNTKAQHYYYVVFNGANAGIYEDWETAKTAVNGVPNVKHKKYRSLLEATTAAKLFAKDNFCAEAKLINSSDCLKPNTFCEALKQGKKTKVSLGRPVQQSIVQKSSNDQDQEEPLCARGFEYWYLEGRRASESKLIEERFFTTDNANVSYFNFLKNSHPDQVYEAFRYGLVRMIYPSNNLQELKSFPKGFVNAIKKFRIKTSKDSGKTDRDVFVKVLSSIPAFDESGVMLHEPHHVIQIGFSKGEKYSPSKVMPSRVEKKDFPELAKVKFSNLLDKVYDFQDEDRIFVNYTDSRILLFSKGSKPIGKEDIRCILQFQQQVTRQDIFKMHFEDICSMIKNKVGPAHCCPLCKATDAIKRSLMVDPTITTSTSSTRDESFKVDGPVFLPAGPIDFLEEE